MNHSLKTPQQGRLTMGQSVRILSSKASPYLGYYSCFYRATIHRDRVPSHLRRNPQKLHLKTSQQGSWWITRKTIIPFLTIMDTINRMTLALVSTHSARSQIERGLVLIKLEIPPEISHLILV